jgi:hypothetical protein
MDAVFKDRVEILNKRRASMISYLEEQSQHWLSPERVDLELVEAFLEKPGLLGQCKERSPYWGYVAQVEDYMAFEDDLPEADPSESELPRSTEKAMELASGIMASYTENYREYKKMREGVDDVGELVEVFRNLEATDDETEAEYEDEEFQFAKEGSHYDDEAGTGYGGSGSGGGGLFGSRLGGGGGGGGFGYRSNPVLANRSPMPPINDEDQDKQKVMEQLARLRARRLPGQATPKGAGPSPASVPVSSATPKGP